MLVADLHRLLQPGAPGPAVFFTSTGETHTGFSALDATAVAHSAFCRPPEPIDLFRRASFTDVTVEEDVL